MFRHCFVCKKIIWLWQGRILSHDLPKCFNTDKITLKNYHLVKKYRTNKKYYHIKCHERYFGFKLDGFYNDSSNSTTTA